MLWLRRNLFLAVGGLAALLLLGTGSYYLWSNRQRNSEVEASLTEKRQALEDIYRNTAAPFPSKENIEAAKAEVEKVRAVVAKAKGFFTAVPAPNVTGPEFRSLLDTAVFELRRRAEGMGIELPSRDYSFSFEAQRKKFTFGEGTFPGMPQQLSEVYTLCNLVFDSQINRLMNIRRTRISADDRENRGAADYHDLSIQSNALTRCLISPYIVDFQCFSDELAEVMRRLQQSTNGLILRSMTVEPMPVAVPDPSSPTPGVAPGTPVPPVGGVRPTVPGRQAPPDPFGKTILDDRLLKVSMMVEMVKCGLEAAASPPGKPAVQSQVAR